LLARCGSAKPRTPQVASNASATIRGTVAFHVGHFGCMRRFSRLPQQSSRKSRLFPVSRNYIGGGQLGRRGTWMTAKPAASPVLQLIRRVVEDPRVRELPDWDLLQRFHSQHDENAFHTLLRRHGPMVLDVCRGVLGDSPDAEDAFQATFLVLAHKAGSIRKGRIAG
jgi:Sigma-70 region 2